MFPDLSYQDLHIQHGFQASIAYQGLSESDCPDIIKDQLSAYCSFDTYVTVRIYQYIKGLCSD